MVVSAGLVVGSFTHPMGPHFCLTPFCAWCPGRALWGHEMGMWMASIDLPNSLLSGGPRVRSHQLCASPSAHTLLALGLPSSCSSWWEWFRRLLPFFFA